MKDRLRKHIMLSEDADRNIRRAAYQMLLSAIEAADRVAGWDRQWATIKQRLKAEVHHSPEVCRAAFDAEGSGRWWCYFAADSSGCLFVLHIAPNRALQRASKSAVLDGIAWNAASERRKDLLP
jgi:hypothetical protein